MKRPRDAKLLGGMGALLITSMLLVACAGQDGQTVDEQGTASGGTAASAETKPGGMPAEREAHVSPDMASYPMPTKLLGQDRVPGLVLNEPHDRTRGDSGDLLVTSVNDTLVVTVCAMRINCCTERVAAGFDGTDNGADVMLYEYLPDVCECFHQRDITFRLYPAPAAGQTLSIRANGRKEVLALQILP